MSTGEESLACSPGLVPIICICGPSAAGKTTFAAGLDAQLRAVGRQPLQIACDDYYRSGWTPHPKFGYDTVDAIDGDQLRSELLSARSRRLSGLRTYDMRRRCVGSRPVDTAYDVILLEGAYGPQLLLSSVPLAVLVYVEDPLLRRLWRRLLRDVRERQRAPFYVIRQMFQEMLPGERAFILPLRQAATVIIRDQTSGVAAVLSALAHRGLVLDT